MREARGNSPQNLRSPRPAKLFDARILRPLRSQSEFFGDEMDDSPGELSTENIQPGKLPPFPQLWVGYLLGLATVIAEFVAASLHPEMEKAEIPIPPLYLFLPEFVGAVYWLVCVYQYHVVMRRVPGWKHPISPARAVGFHFIPIYYLYWIFKWPLEIARFVNWRFGKPFMKPLVVGLMVFAGFLLLFFFDPGLGLIMLFLAASYVSGCLRRAFALPSAPTASTPPSAE